MGNACSADKRCCQKDYSGGTNGGGANICTVQIVDMLIYWAECDYAHWIYKP